MSKERKLIELIAPDVVRKRGVNEHERLIEPYMKCNYCDGRGMVFDYEDEHGEHSKKCPMCHGYGHMTAVVNIEWVPLDSLKSTD
jgi:hypothetical protein